MGQMPITLSQEASRAKSLHLFGLKDSAHLVPGENRREEKSSTIPQG